ncbi:hypothetical protein C8Q74DRAFT_1366150 [Fomes fomentarius]|nr:hypothetical protein C8Q74DRAFT_1366150 [Fomes fomentarius]
MPLSTTSELLDPGIPDNLRRRLSSNKRKLDEHRRQRHHLPGGNGIAFGSLGQYVQFNDIVNNVLLEDLNLIRLDSQVQPNMVSGVYFKSWDGTVTRRVTFDQVTLPIGGHSDGPSTLRFSNLTFEDWVGTAQRNTKASSTTC